MKKIFLSSFFLILIVGTHINGMTRAIKKPSPRKTYTTQRVTFTKNYTKPTLRNKLQQYYTQFRQWLWGPSKTPKMIVAETNELVENIRQEKPNSVKDFDIFLSTHTQDEVNIFLSTLVVTEEGLALLNQYIPHIIVNQMKYKKARTIFKKIITWIKYDISAPFKEDSPIDDSFFLIPLTVLIPNEIIPTLIKNYDLINRQSRGKQFFTLIDEEDPGLYRIILMKHILLQEKSKLITKE